MIYIRLDRLLAERGMTRYRLAQLTGIKYQTIDNYYKNRVLRFDGYILSQICKMLQCSIGELLEYQDE